MKWLLDYFILGGSLMWVLLGCSIIGLAIILERAVVYVRYGFSPDAWLEKVLADIRSGRIDAARQSAHQNPHPVARVVEAYLANLSRPANVRMDNVKRTGSLELEKVEQRLRTLAALAHLAPLIGLLGTVAGMVVAFSGLQAITGPVKPSDLAGGIWEALLTTVFGLVVAIPCMAAFHAYESHADKIARRMELAVNALNDAFSLTGEGTASSAIRNDATGSEEWNTVGS